MCKKPEFMCAAISYPYIEKNIPQTHKRKNLYVHFFSATPKITTNNICQRPRAAERTINIFIKRNKRSASKQKLQPDLEISGINLRKNDISNSKTKDIPKIQNQQLYKYNATVLQNAVTSARISRGSANKCVGSFYFF